MEKATANTSADHGGGAMHPRESDISHVKVRSVALADAVAKDSINRFTPSQFKLYGIMLFCTLSRSMETVGGSKE